MRETLLPIDEHGKIEIAPYQTMDAQQFIAQARARNYQAEIRGNAVYLAMTEGEPLESGLMPLMDATQFFLAGAKSDILGDDIMGTLFTHTWEFDGPTVIIEQLRPEES